MGSGTIKNAGRAEKINFAGKVRALAAAVDAAGLWIPGPATIPGLGINYKPIKGLGGIPADILVTVFALETGWGMGNVFIRSNNLGSIKQGSIKAWPGPIEQNGHRTYPSWTAALRDFVRLMHIDYYRPALIAAQKRDFVGYFAEMQRLGYEGTITDYHARLARTASELGALNA